MVRLLIMACSVLKISAVNSLMILLTNAEMVILPRWQIFAGECRRGISTAVPLKVLFVQVQWIVLVQTDVRCFRYFPLCWQILIITDKTPDTVRLDFLSSAAVKASALRSKCPMSANFRKTSFLKWRRIWQDFIFQVILWISTLISVSVLAMPIRLNWLRQARRICRSIKTEQMLKYAALLRIPPWSRQEVIHLWLLWRLRTYTAQ